jgi:hypothetical protein
MQPMPSVTAGGRRGPGWRAWLCGLVVGLVAALAVPPASTAAVSVVPSEPGAMLLNAPTYGALVGDVAGDGSRDLVRLVAYAGDSGQMAVDVWRRSAGGWTDLGEAPLRRGVGVDERLAQPGLVGRDGMRPVQVTDVARLLAWRDGHGEHVLVAVNSAIAYPPASPCCLTLWEVQAPPTGAGPPTLHLLVDTQRPATAIQSLDMDGDGIDEILFEQPPEAGQPGIRVGLLTWSPSPGSFAFQQVAVPAAAGSQRGSLSVLGESDGLPGAEAALVVPSGSPSAPSLLVSISLPGGRLLVEEATVPRAGTPLAVQTASGPAIVVSAGRTSSLAQGAPVVIDWPTGWPAASRTLPFGAAAPVAALGSGTDTRILFAAPGQVVMAVTDGSLNPLPGVTAGNAAAPYLSTALLPYVGPFPGGLPDGEPAVVFGGKLVRADAANPTPANQGLRVDPMAVLPGMAPLGWLGPGGTWTALLVSLTGSVTADEVDRSGGQLTSGTEYALALARTSDVLAPEEEDGQLQPAIAGGLAASPAGGHPAVITRDGTFAALLDVPPGSLVRGLAHDRGNAVVVGPAELPSAGQSGAAPPYEVQVGAPVTGDQDQRFDTAISVVTPAGHGYVATWTVWAYRKPPPLTVSTPGASFGFSVKVAGHTSVGSTVQIDGRSVAVAADGSFASSVPAGPLPSEVTVVARDAVGNRTERVLSVVAPIDYRRLPWIPIIVGLTLLVAAAFVVRVPRGRGWRGADQRDAWIDDDFDGPIDDDG